MVKREIGVKDGGKGLVQSVVNWYLNNYLKNLFAGAWEARDPTPLPVHMPEATSSQVQKCAEIVSRGKKPVVILGSQATLPPVPAEHLAAALGEYSHFLHQHFF